MLFLLTCWLVEGGGAVCGLCVCLRNLFLCALFSLIVFHKLQDSRERQVLNQSFNFCMCVNARMVIYSVLLSFPSDSPMPVTSRVCFVKFQEPESVGVSQHLTNTVFVDRALIVVPFAEGWSPLTVLDGGVHVSLHGSVA